MKILHLVTYANHGGAGIAARRLHETLLASGVESQILCADLCDETIIQINPFRKYGSFPTKLYNYLRSINTITALKQKICKSIQYSYNGRNNFALVRAIEVSNPDVIHLHWINDGFLNLNQLAKFNKPIVWSCHDMWAFTGGCHYNGNCPKWKTGCYDCHLISDITSSDVSHKQFVIKKESICAIAKLHMVGLSTWMYNSIKESLICQGVPVSYIPNTIDKDTFSIVSKVKARKELGIDNANPLVLFGAMNLTDERKGLKYLIDALSIIEKEMNLNVIAVGNITDHSALLLPNLNIRLWGKAANKEELCQLYSAANVVVLPSIQENLSNMVIESLLCGTPVAGFNIGGNSDMIHHKDNGFLSDSISGEGLAKAISWILDNHINPVHCRETILEKFNNDITLNKYLMLYKNMIC